MTRPPTEPVHHQVGSTTGQIHDSASFTTRLAACRARALNALLDSGVVLELGCRDGRLTHELARHHGLVVAVDPERDNVERAKRHLAGACVDVYQSRLETFEPPVGVRFDAIIATRWLQSIESPVAILTRCKNWLTDDGAIVVVTALEPFGRRIGLRRQFAAAGMRVRKTGGIMFKPVPRSKVHRLPREIVAAHAALGDRAPNLSAEMFALAVRDH